MRNETNQYAPPGSREASAGLSPDVAEVLGILRRAETCSRACGGIEPRWHATGSASDRVDARLFR